MFLKIPFFIQCYLALNLMVNVAYAYHPTDTQKAPDDIIQDWLLNEFQPSTLSLEEQKKELKWFHTAAKPFKNMTIRVVSERIATHHYESDVLAKAFHEITGIHVIHEITGEDDVIKKLQAQLFTGENLYDAYINDSDLIGFHFRSNETVQLDTFMKNEGRNLTLPTLDLSDFIGLKFTTGPDGHLYQLPDQQFVNLYWYRADWFERKDLQEKFLAIYGYPLGVPQNWSAYEDIAEFFSLHIKEIDGERIWGHMDYGKRDPSLGWRISDAWLSIGGTGDKGLPNGLPVDDWGIRVEGCRPVGASTSRGGALDSPAAIYSVSKYIDWLDKYAPPEAKNLNFTEAGKWLAKGNIAQQIWWYSAFTADLTQPNTPIVDDDGKPKWKMAPTPKGAYWEPGMKLGYQDTGAWTFLKNTPKNRMEAAWLYAQFVTSKTVSLKKTFIGLTPFRQSDIQSEEMTKKAPYLGGLVEFYRSPGKNLWTPTGTNVPDYTQLSHLWWQHIGLAVDGTLSVREAMEGMANDVDNTLLNISKNSLSECAPSLNTKTSRDEWLNKVGAPKQKTNEKPLAKTLPYKDAVNALP